RDFSMFWNYLPWWFLDNVQSSLLMLKNPVPCLFVKIGPNPRSPLGAKSIAHVVLNFRLHVTFLYAMKTPKLNGEFGLDAIGQLSFYPLREADIYSRFIRAMFSKEIPLGHSTSQAPVLVQFPKPSRSIASTMFNTRSTASTRPCGNKAN